MLTHNYLQTDILQLCTTWKTAKYVPSKIDSSSVGIYSKTYQQYSNDGNLKK